MNNIKDALKVYQSFLSNRFRALAEPLDTCFGINEFIYTYITGNGSFFVISNQPAPSEYYFSHHFYQSSALFRHPDNYQPGALLPTTIPNEKQEEIEVQMEGKFGYSADTLLIILRREKNVLHKFLFNTSNKKLPIVSFYLNNLSLLEKFCDYFLKEWAAYLKEMEKYTIDIAQLVGPSFYTIDSSNLFMDEIQKKEAFLKSIGEIPQSFILPGPFSRQERACLDLIFTGKTMKETSDILDLSPRTVEYYFENIKNKMNCMTKSEVIEQLHYLKALGIL